MYVIKFVEASGSIEHCAPGQWQGAYLKSYSPEAHDGLGFAEWTHKRPEAMLFITPGDALALTRQQPTNRPWRTDGKPNRPIMAFTMSIEEAK